MQDPESLMKKLGIEIHEVHQQMEFMDITERDLRLLSEMAGAVGQQIDRIVSKVHDRLLTFDKTKSWFKTEEETNLSCIIEREYLLESFRGKVDEGYVEKRLEVGALLYRSGLAATWYIGVQCLYENILLELIAKAFRDQFENALPRIKAVQKIFSLNNSLTLAFYRYCMTSQLKGKIKDLDDFTYVVSHDLKEPLRGIEAFSTFLMEDYSHHFDEKGTQYLNFLKESSVYMKDLINDLLTISSISSQELKIQKVDLNQVIRNVLNHLRYSIQQKGAEIEVTDLLPTLLCDPIQIGEVFQNLISNAIKFNNSIPPRVKIRAEDKGAYYRFSVKDNGIGIDPRYTKRVFQLFDRLNPREDFEGTGAGLAICKKIIERFGGTIKFDSQPGKGSDFYFTLSKSLGKQPLDDVANLYGLRGSKKF